MLICVGINDTTHATMAYNLKPNENNVLVNAQDFQGTFKLLDNTLSKVFPKADIRLAPLIATKDKAWQTCELSQNAFHAINALIRERKHVKLDSYQPVNKNWLCNDGIHFKDYDGVKFWKTIFKQIDWEKVKISKSHMVNVPNLSSYTSLCTPAQWTRCRLSLHKIK